MKYGTALMIVGILLLIVVLRRRGKKLIKKRKIQDEELKAFREQIYQQYEDTQTYHNVNRRVRERKYGGSTRRK